MIVEKARVVHNRTRIIATVNKLYVETTILRTNNPAVKTKIVAVMKVLDETTQMILIMSSNTGTSMMNISVHVENKLMRLPLLNTSLIILSIYPSSLNLTARNWVVNLVIATVFRVNNFLESITILKVNTKNAHVENRHRPWRRKQGSKSRMKYIRNAG